MLLTMNFKIEELHYSDYITVFATLILPLIAVCVYGIGVYFHFKVIKVSFKEKDITWKLDITNSIILTVHHGYFLFMKIITFVIQDLHAYTGTWLCYLSKVAQYLGGLHISAHTLVIAILKYIMIVRWDWAMVVGQDKIKKAFFFIDFLHPILILSVLLLVRTDFLVEWDSPSEEIDRCLGDPKNNLDPARNHSLTKLHHLCQIDTPFNDNNFENFGYYFKTSICWAHFTIFYLCFSNLLEVLFYTLIFKFMRR